MATARRPRPVSYCSRSTLRPSVTPDSANASQRWSVRSSSSPARGCRARVGSPTALAIARRASMKSFQVVDFRAPLKEVDQPTPQPAGTQVLIKVKAAGVCHSDLHIWEGGYDLGHGRKPLSLKDR